MTAMAVLLLAAVLFLVNVRMVEGDSEAIGICNSKGAVTHGHSAPENWRIDPARFIAHAGGAIDGRTYTDSREAIMQAIGHGYRMIELDLLMTSDGHIIAAHDWAGFKKRTGTVGQVDDRPLSLAEVKSRRIDGRYTPLDEGQIRDIFTKNPHLILVTDKIRNFQRLVSAFPFQDRIVVEIFSKRDVLAARQAGIVNPMFSVSNLEYSLEFILQSDIAHVALSTAEMLRCPAAAARLIASGKKVFVFTANEPDFMGRYIGSHASAFYTDFWNVAKGRCDGPCPNARTH